MTEVLLAILAIELGLILFAMVGIFGLDALSVFARNRAESTPQRGTLRVLTEAEMIANGLNPADFLNPSSSKLPGPTEVKVEASGQYL